MSTLGKSIITDNFIKENFDSIKKAIEEKEEHYQGIYKNQRGKYVVRINVGIFDSYEEAESFHKRSFDLLNQKGLVSPKQRKMTQAKRSLTDKARIECESANRSNAHWTMWEAIERKFENYLNSNENKKNKTKNTGISKRSMPIISKTKEII